MSNSLKQQHSAQPK